MEKQEQAWRGKRRGDRFTQWGEGVQEEAPTMIPMKEFECVSLIIAVVTRGMLPVAFVENLSVLGRDMRDAGVTGRTLYIQPRADLCFGRSLAARTSIQFDCTHILFLDDDIIPEWEQVEDLLRVCKTWGRAAGDYVTRAGLTTRSEELQQKFDTAHPFVGGGCLMFTKEFLSDIVETNDGYVSTAEVFLCADGKSTEYLADDYSISLRCSGFPIIDGIIGHLNANKK